MIRRLCAPLLALFLSCLILGQDTARAQYVSGTPILGVPNTFTTVTVGASGTQVTQIRIYAPSLTPTITSAAIQTVTQTFAVVGITTTDKIHVIGPTPTSLCPMVMARASAADQIAIDFLVLTAVACTPAAGTYTVVAVRS